MSRISNNIFQLNSNIDDEDIIVYYKGVFSSELMEKTRKSIEELLCDKPQVSSKIYRVFIEMAQNIAYYSADTNKFISEKGEKEGVGAILIYKDGQDYVIKTGNMIYNKDIKSIIDKSVKINSMERNDLRELKRENRRKSRQELVNVNVKGSAHIGLIQIALLADNPLEVRKIESDSKYSFCTITTKISSDSK